MSDSSATAGGTVTAHDPRTDDLQAVLEHLAIPQATAIIEAADRIARAHLASMGGDLLATYDPEDGPTDHAMATLGGYLLERFGGDR